jgi:hypothetical protein
MQKKASLFVHHDDINRLDNAIVKPCILRNADVIPATDKLDHEILKSLCSDMAKTCSG